MGSYCNTLPFLVSSCLHFIFQIPYLQELCREKSANYLLQVKAQDSLGYGLSLQFV